MVAEACNPEWTSVPLLGWRGTAALAALADVHLATQVRNRAAVTAAKPGWPCSFIDNEHIAGPMYRAASLMRGGSNRAWTLNSLIASLSYPAFEKGVWREMGSAIRNHQFDVVHRLTPVSPGIAGNLAKRCKAAGVPFVLGPINGGVPYPPGFQAEQRREGERLAKLRSLQKLRPSYHALRRCASAILVGSTVAMDDLAPPYRSRAVLLPENAVFESEVINARTDWDEAPLRIVFVGRLVPLKGVSMLIEAARRAAAKHPESFHLTIVGDGPERASLERQERGRASIEFTGALSHDAVMRLLERQHLLVFPSIREFGGGAVVEAMARGVTPIVADYGGPRDIVDEMCGTRVPLLDREQFTAGLESAIEAYLADRTRLREHGTNARARVRSHFTWEARAKTMIDIYERLLAEARGQHNAAELQTA